MFRIPYPSKFRLRSFSFFACPDYFGGTQRKPYPDGSKLANVLNPEAFRDSVQLAVNIGLLECEK